MFEDPFTPQYYRRLQQLTIRSRRAVLGSQQGVHLSARKGHGLEFAEYRPYVPGDEFRHIDWGVLARTDKVFVKQFREEQDLTVVLILDSTASMHYPEAAYKFEFAAYLALSLACIALSDGDTVQVYLIGGKRSQKFRGIRSLSRIKSFIFSDTLAVPSPANSRLGSKKREPSAAIDLPRELQSALAQQKLPGACFVFSDFLYREDQLREGLDALRYRNFDLRLIRIAAPAELSLQLPDNAVLVDSETGEELEIGLDSDSARIYALALADTIAWLEQYSLRYGIHHLVVPTNTPLIDVVVREFTQRGMLR